MIVRLLTLLLALSCCNASYANKQEDLDNLRKRIAEMQHEMEKTSASESAVADALRESERGISNSNRRLAELAEQQQAADATLQQLQNNEQQLEKSLQTQQQSLNQLLRQQYMSGKQEYLRLLLNSRDPSEVSRHLQYYQYIARSRAAWMDDLRKDLDGLKQAREATAKQRTELASLHNEQAEQTKKLQQEQQARQHMQVKIAQQLREQRREMFRLQRDENRLADLITRLSKVIAAQSKVKPSPAEKNAPAAPEIRNDKLPTEQFSGAAFSQLRGKLVLPVRGSVSNRFGAPRPDSNVAWKGLFLKTTSGQAVKAIAAGRVVFSDWMRGFGNLLVIDHGHGYMSVYGNNETLYKQVGDVLKGGETIASVGNSGGNEDSGLYFELRYESKPFDPMTWLAK